MLSKAHLTSHSRMSGSRSVPDCYSVAQSCPTLCNPVDCSTPGLPVLHRLQELAQTRPLSQSVMPSNHLILCRPLASWPQSFLASGSFLMSRLFASGGQSTGASASASVLPVNIQGWFRLGLTGRISLQSRGPSRVFNTTFKSINSSAFFMVQLSHPYMTTGKTIAFQYTASKAFQNCVGLLEIVGTPIWICCNHTCVFNQYLKA